MAEKKNKSRGWIPADVAMAELAADPEYQKLLANQEAEHAKRIAEQRAAEAPIVKDLQAAGVPIRILPDILELRSEAAEYAIAVEVLARHLAKKYPPNTRSIIAEAISVPAAAKYWKQLVTEYLREEARNSDPSLRFGVALAMCVTDATADEFVSLLSRPKSSGTSGLMFGIYRLPPAFRQKAMEIVNADAELKREHKKDKAYRRYVVPKKA